MIESYFDFILSIKKGIIDLLDEYLSDGFISCRGCGLAFDLDDFKCLDCNWINPLCLYEIDDFFLVLDIDNSFC